MQTGAVERAKNIGEVVIQVRRVAEPSSSGGVWKWFAMAFIMIAALVWFVVKSGDAL
jgi:hypothetical protein